MPEYTKSPMSAADVPRLAFVMLFAGAMIIGFSPILMRLSQIGPVSTAFYRLSLSLPFFWLLVWLPRNRVPWPSLSSGQWRNLILLGAVFALNLSCWHTAIELGTVANATVLANLAPVFVAFGAWWLFDERLGWRFLLSLLFGIVGVMLLVGHSLSLSQQNLLGDGFALLTALSYAAYLLLIRRLRRVFLHWQLLAVVVTVATMAILPLAWWLEGDLIPDDAAGWAVMALLAIGSQVIGQGLIVYALAHLPVSFSSLVLLMQPVVAAFLAWQLFAESLSLFQWLGIVLVMGAIWLAQFRRHRAVQDAPPTAAE